MPEQAIGVEEENIAATPPNELLEKLLLAYGGYFDLHRDINVGGLVFPALAEYHSRSEKYVLVKKARLWGMEQNEYIYVWQAKTLTMEGFEQLVARVKTDGLARIQPHSEHMYTHISLVVLAEQIPAETVRELRRCRFSKSFRFSFYGWMELRVAAYCQTAGEAYCNVAGRSLRKTLIENIVCTRKGK